MSENSLSRTSETAPVRTLAEIKISIQAHSRMAAESILQIGRDLIEAKQVAGHGGWLPFLADIGFKPSTAENWMRLAREIAPGSALAALSPTKALALLQLPQEEREAFAQEHGQDKSAAELRRLIEERNRAAEAANAETARADAAEKRLEDAHQQAEQLARECDYYKGQAAQIEQERKAAERRAQELGKQLDDMISNQPVSIKTVEVPVEKIPEDYEQMKQRLQWADQNVDDALAAATQAQEWADQLEAELEKAKAQGGGRMEPEGLEALTKAVNQFITETQLMAVNPGALARREKEADALIRRLKLHVIELEKAIGDAAFAAEGAVL